MKQITIDIETASDENIKDCGIPLCRVGVFRLAAGLLRCGQWSGSDL